MTKNSVQTGITRQKYWQWVNDAAALATALGYPVQPTMINEGTGIVFGDDQYEAFTAGLWSGEAFEVMVILEALNEPAIDGLPAAGGEFAEFGGLCDKLMILHPGKFCPSHFHPRKTESYEVVLGEMDLFYSPSPVEAHDERLVSAAMPEGGRWPDEVALPSGRENSYAALTSYRRLRKGDPKFVMHRRHLHAFRCPPESTVPLVVREISTYSHEPTAAMADRAPVAERWSKINDNVFLSEAAGSGRLAANFLD